MFLEISNIGGIAEAESSLGLSPSYNIQSQWNKQRICEALPQYLER